MRDKFREHSCDFKNENECEEELDEVDADMDEEEKSFYEEENLF